jgi:hypothetical protein
MKTTSSHTTAFPDTSRQDQRPPGHERAIIGRHGVLTAATIEPNIELLNNSSAEGLLRSHHEIGCIWRDKLLYATARV